MDPKDYDTFFPSFSPAYTRSVQWILNLSQGLPPAGFVDWDPSDSDLGGGSGSDDEPPPIRIGMNYGHHDPFDHEKPHYSSVDPCNSIQIGDRLDIMSLLSTCRDGLVRSGATNKSDFVKVESLLGKYVLFFCAFVPAKWIQSNTRNLCLLSLLSSELRNKHDFEMVMVAKMRNGWDDDEYAFDQFFSAFPGCLAVPFSDKCSRDRICNSLGFNGKLNAIFVDPDQIVLQDRVGRVVAYGGTGFPFTDKRLKELGAEWTVACQNRSLAGILGCDDSVLHLSNLNNSKKTTSVEQLSKTLVGLYMYQRGDKCRAFRDVYQQCRDKGYEFEIILICIPYSTSIHPMVFHQEVVKALKKFMPDVSWWVFPYHHSACRRFWSMCTESSEDDMIIVGPDRKFFVEKRGGGVINHFGVEAYPFNREVIVNKFLKNLKAVTLESFLSYGPINYVLRDGERVPVADLHGKNVLVYVDFEIAEDLCVYDQLVKWYNELKKNYSDFEMVFVYYGDPDPGVDNSDSTACHCKSSSDMELLLRPCRCQSSSDMELLLRPFDSKHSSFLKHHDAFSWETNGRIRLGLPPASVLAFGKDGHIYSQEALTHFQRYGLNAYPFRCECSDLRREIISHITCDFEFMRGYAEPFGVLTLD